MSYIEDKAIMDDAKETGGWWSKFIMVIMILKLILLVIGIYLGISFLVVIW